MALALLSLGSNVGDRAAQLQAAVARIQNLPNTSLLRLSRDYAFAAVGGPTGQAEFLNAAALVDTMLAPAELLAALQRIETELARVRRERWGPRTIDLDLLLYDELVLESPELTIPHPRMAFRRFVLAPAVEIAPELRHSAIGWTVRQLWEHLNSAPNYVALHGGTAKFRRDLLRIVARDSAAVIGEFSRETLSSADNAPKLLVRLDDSPLPMPYEGPVLRLATDDLNLATSEVVAAIQAMR